jgi:hypothetical protein
MGHLMIMVIFGLVVSFLVFLAMRNRGTAPSEPSCGKCGYLVKGLTGLTCPECGSDLREVGITSLGLSGSGSSAARGIFQTHHLLFLGNLWLIIALLLYVGGHVERTQPIMYSFFGVSKWMSPSKFYLFIGFAVLAAVFHFLLLMRKGR